MSNTLTQLKAYFISLVCESIFAGLYTFIFGAALYIQLRHREKGRTNVVILGLTITMYFLSMTHLTFCFYVSLSALFGQKAATHAENTDQESLKAFFNVFACTPIVAETLNCIIGDSIVIWRTWVLWNRSYRIIYFPCALLVGGTVAGIFMIRTTFATFAGASPFNSSTISAVIAFCTLTTTLNIYAIIAIGYRVWIHSRAMKDLGGHGAGLGDSGGLYRSVFLIFVESGFIYCILPILMLILYSTSNNGVFIVIGILCQITGIYPTAIIVLVCLQLTQHDRITRMTESAINFRKSTNILNRNSGVVSTPYRSKHNAILEEKQDHFVMVEDKVLV